MSRLTDLGEILEWYEGRNYLPKVDVDIKDIAGKLKQDDCNKLSIGYLIGDIDEKTKEVQVNDVLVPEQNCTEDDINILRDNVYALFAEMRKKNQKFIGIALYCGTQDPAKIFYPTGSYIPAGTSCTDGILIRINNEMKYLIAQKDKNHMIGQEQ